ncbi:hypothetical protein NQ317_018830, partial [Molorchus minor]
RASDLSAQDVINVVPIEGGVNGTGVTTRYWDCCKPSCAWVEAANITPPVASCEADGVTQTGFDEQSGCAEEEEGYAFTCNNQQPTIINDTFSLGFVAASFSGGIDESLCCACLLLTFEDELEGKQLLAQVTNTGEDLVQNHFDIEMPGGGVGIFNMGCIRQWGAPEDGWGERYGGVTSEEGCDDLPEVLQEGCRYRFEWMNGVPNPNVTFYQVECPQQLIDITGCTVPTR